MINRTQNSERMYYNREKSIIREVKAEAVFQFFFPLKMKRAK